MKVNKIKMIALTAQKVKEDKGPYAGYDKTLLFQDGKLKAEIPASSTQPRRGQKTIMLNGWKFELVWK